MLGGTRATYSQLVANLQNSFILGADQYPKDVEECYDMMLGYFTVIGTSASSSKEVKNLYTTGISFYPSPRSNEEEIQDNDTINETMPGLSGKILRI